MKEWVRYLKGLFESYVDSLHWPKVMRRAAVWWLRGIAVIVVSIILYTFYLDFGFWAVLVLIGCVGVLIISIIAASIALN